RSRGAAALGAGWPGTYTVGAESEWTVKGVVTPVSVAIRPDRLAETSPIFEYVQATRTPSQPAGEAGPAMRWSPSSAVKTKSVFSRLMPCLERSLKKAAKAESYCFSWAT